MEDSSHALHFPRVDFEYDNHAPPIVLLGRITLKVPIKHNGLHPPPTFSEISRD